MAGDSLLGADGTPTLAPSAKTDRSRLQIRTLAPTRAIVFHRALLAATSGVLLCMVHGYAPALVVLAPIAVLLAVRRATPRQAFYLGLLCGALESFILTGVIHAGAPLYAALCLGYALFRAVFSVTLVSLWRASRAQADVVPTDLGTAIRSIGYTLLAPALWAICEWLHVQVPHSLPNLLGDTQHVGPLLPLARVGGTHLIGFVVVWLAAAVAFSIDVWFRPVAFHTDESSRPRGRQRWVATVLGVPVAVLLTLELWAYVDLPKSTGELSVTVVQGGLPTWVYAKAYDVQSWHALPEDVYVTLTKDAAKADLTVWPETSVWRMWGEDTEWQDTLRGLQAHTGGAMLVGTPRKDKWGSLYNSGVLIDGHGAEPSVDKRRLVIRAEARFYRGEEPALLDWDKGRLGVVFCLESVVPDYGRELVRNGAQALVVLSEGGRFGTTPVGRMHAQRSTVRAVEAGRTLVHAGQQGYSTVITASGERPAPLPAFYAGSLHARLPLSQGLTSYVRWGDWIVGLSVLVVVLRILGLSLGSRSRSTTTAHETHSPAR